MIKLEGIKKKYTIGSEIFYALDGVDMHVDKGEFVAIMGPSGSGKSTMLHIIGCLDTPSHGKYILNGKDVTHMSDDELSEVRNKEIGFVFQAFNLLPQLSVYDNTLLPFVYSDVPHKEHKERVLDAIERVGLTSKLNNRPNQLSGGQRQRVAIARSLVMRPSIILADEPTGNLDSKTSEQIMEILNEIHKGGATIVLITHEGDIAAHAERVVNLKDGRVVASS